jgi:hypothetical protein
MLKLLMVFFIVSFADCKALFAQTDERYLNSREPPAFDDSVVIEIKKVAEPFYGISLRFTDRNINKVLTSIFAMRKRGASYIVDDKQYDNINAGIEDYLKNLFDRIFNEFYYNDETLDKNTEWSEFVENGTFQFLMDSMDTLIDIYFLNAPFYDSDG